MFSFLRDDKGNEINTVSQNRVPIAYPTIDDLPKGAQGYTVNNRYNGFPPLMADGRALVASWQPEAETNNLILQRNNIRSNWEYRQYLTNNAPQIMRENFIQSANDIGYYERNATELNEPNYKPVLATSMSRPFLYSSILEQPSHLGNENTDLKMEYLSREQLNAQQYAPVVTQAELIQMTKQNKSSAVVRAK
jgi:hypothetical protein